jgi:hypothetical protein
MGRVSSSVGRRLRREKQRHKQMFGDKIIDLWRNKYCSDMSKMDLYR